MKIKATVQAGEIDQGLEIVLTGGPEERDLHRDIVNVVEKESVIVTGTVNEIVIVTMLITGNATGKEIGPEAEEIVREKGKERGIIVTEMEKMGNVSLVFVSMLFNLFASCGLMQQSKLCPLKDFESIYENNIDNTFYIHTYRFYKM